MKPIEVWLIRDYEGSYFIQLGSKPKRDESMKRFSYDPTNCPQRIYVAGDDSAKYLSEFHGKGMEKDSCRRLA